MVRADFATLAVEDEPVGVRAPGDALHPHLAGRGMKEGDQLGGAMPNVFMRVPSRLTGP